MFLFAPVSHFQTVAALASELLRPAKVGFGLSWRAYSGKSSIVRSAFSIWKNRESGLLWLAVVLLVFAGCAAPKVMIRSEGNLCGYRKVYLAPIRNDPLGMEPRIAARLRQGGFKVVEIKPTDPPLESQGSGFVITPQGHVLTCAHVVKGQTNATVWIEGVRHVGRVVGADSKLDAAVILLEDGAARFHPLQFAPACNYHLGQEVYTMGFPLAEVLGTSPRLNKGLVSSTVGLGDDTNQLQVSVEVQPGNSGGPLLNEHGEVIGMVAATLNPMQVFARTGGNLPQNVNFAIQAGPLQRFVHSWGVFLHDTASAPPAADFESARQSLALVRGGLVEEKDLKQPVLMCHYSYERSGELVPHLGKFLIEFYDPHAGKRVLLAGVPSGRLFSSEDSLLDRVFGDIAPFFPDRFNTLKKN